MQVLTGALNEGEKLAAEQQLRGSKKNQRTEDKVGGLLQQDERNKYHVIPR